MSIQQIVIAGHSHSAALGVPIKTSDNRPARTPIRATEPPIVGLSGSWPRDDAYWDELERLAPDSTIAISWNGNQHVAYFMFESHPPFDFLASSRPDLPVDDNAYIVPEALVREHFMPTILALPKLLSRLKSATGSLVVLGTPPPKGDNAKLRALLDTERHFPALAQRTGLDISTVQLTSGLLRLKLWTVIQDILMEVADQNGCLFVPVPESAKTGVGCLREDLWSNDVTHANRKYGDLMLGEIEKCLGCVLPRPATVTAETIA